MNLQYRCATLSGLDSRDGVLLLGSSHFYVIEGLTINNYGEIVDIETAHEEYVSTSHFFLKEKIMYIILFLFVVRTSLWFPFT